jgi:hypothetical protein
MEIDRVAIFRQIYEGEGFPGHTYLYPYSDLPHLVSHIHPKFVIFNTGSKLKKLAKTSSKEALRKLFVDNPGLEKIQILHNAWIQPPTIGYELNESYEDPNIVLVEEDSSFDDSEDGEYDYRTNRTKSGRGDGFRPRTRSVAVERDDIDRTNRTKSGRGDGFRPRKRSLAAAGRATKRRKVLAATHSQQLSKATLTRFNQQFGEAVWTADRIRQWSKTFLMKKPVSRRHLPIHRSSHDQ